MASLEWEPGFSVGVRELDQQHQQLLVLINALSSVTAETADDKHFFTSLNGLVNYAETHFVSEERLMQAHGFPDAQRHAEEHVRFVKQVFVFAERLEAGDANIQFQVLRFLKDWYFTHVLGVDKKYATFFAAKGIR